MKNRVFKAILLALVVAAAAVLTACGGAEASEIEFTDVERHTREFMAYEASIELTPEQQTVFRQALEPMPAPCCSDNSAYTCCCPCNLAKTWWGLAKYLIADLGYDDPEKVRVVVQEWFDFINTDGFSGDICPTGGCNRSFANDGCGGMNPNRVVY